MNRFTLASRLGIALVLSAILLGGQRLTPVAAQQQPPATQQKPSPPPTKTQQEDDGDTIAGGTVVNVSLPVTVFNGDGNFVSGLKREQFQVLENRQVQPIVDFRKMDGVPLNVALLMDTSTSVRNRLAFEKEAVTEFLEKILDNRRDRASLVTFNDEVEFRHPFTTEFPRIAEAVRTINKADGRTSLYDAVCKVCNEQMGNSSGKRRAILALTDGADTGSRNSLEKAISTAQRAEVAVYAISTKGGAVFRVEGNPYRNIDDKDLRRLCKETGGDVFFPNDTGQLKRAFEIAKAYLRNQYFLVYEPTEFSSPGQFRQIEVRILGRPDLRVLARRGYFSN